MSKRKDEETIFLKIKNINTDKEWQELLNEKKRKEKLRRK